jgi:hypothetical protein
MSRLRLRDSFQIDRDIEMNPSDMIDAVLPITVIHARFLHSFVYITISTATFLVITVRVA